MENEFSQTFEENGAILIKGIFKKWVPKIISGIEKNLSTPSQYANENNVDSGNPHPRVALHAVQVNNAGAAKLEFYTVPNFTTNINVLL